MILQQVILSYAAYNHWANEKLCCWLTDLNKELLDTQTPSSFASIALTIRHMEQSQQFWLGIIAGPQPPLPDETDAAATTFSRLLAGSKRMTDTFGAYTDKELAEEVASTDMVQSRYAFILHAINHNSYHRGQIVTMSRQLGIVDNIPAMDYEVYLWRSIESTHPRLPRI